VNETCYLNPFGSCHRWLADHCELCGVQRVPTPPAAAPAGADDELIERYEYKDEYRDLCHSSDGDWVGYDDHVARIAALSARLAAAEADAERYRWLRDKCIEADVRAGLGWIQWGFATLDAAIDAARAKGKG